jgi:hypothetical protein
MDNGAEMIFVAIALFLLAMFAIPVWFLTPWDWGSKRIDFNHIAFMEMEIWGQTFPDSWNSYEQSKMSRVKPPPPPTKVKPMVYNQNAQLGPVGAEIDPATGYPYTYRGDLENIIAPEFRNNGGGW